MFYVYVIKSSTSGRIYIGQTNNPTKRLSQHNSKDLDRRSFTKLSGKDWKLIYKEVCDTREEALKREKVLKSHKGRDWLKTVLGAVAQW